MFRKFSSVDCKPTNMLLQLRQRETVANSKLDEGCYFPICSIDLSEISSEKIIEFVNSKSVPNLYSGHLLYQTESEAELGIILVLKLLSNDLKAEILYNQEFKDLPFEKKYLKKDVFWIVKVEGNASWLSQRFFGLGLRSIIKDTFITARNNLSSETLSRSQALAASEQAAPSPRP